MIATVDVFNVVQMKFECSEDFCEEIFETSSSSLPSISFLLFCVLFLDCSC